MIRILIADDHAIVRKGLVQILLEHYPTAKIGEVEDAEQLIHKAVTEEWEVVICDLSMPGRSGLDALHQLKQVSPKLP
ncbi:MAG: response regulator, partial [Bacteroidota bacterium]